ncbi:MAG TPA: ABC transporter substrate-binding protein [Rhodopila sp.]|uniref:ABC transporter substrate-binding protein n=1 Tax=Rhodopila sp. TaxID=2480087 RepID=UPI002D06D305|nr:ABC transporter substrate-binding protein [Rhodopila sp.]HVY16038.1 ABC transporter substrate-binding protein [Rhodopila sp.]
MKTVGRRSVMGASLGLAASTVLARPYVANAEATTTIAWINQGFVQQEVEAFRRTAAEYEKASGNKIDYNIMPFMALNQRIIAALTSGDVPDLIFHDAPATILPQNAWDNKLTEVSDVVEAYKSQLSRTAVAASTYYNNATKKRDYYLVPIKQACIPFHIWGSLVEKAGYKLSDAPDTWDAFHDFFKPVQKSLRQKGMRRVFAMGMSMTTVGPNDGNGLFMYFVVANGGRNIVTPDGQLHADDPQVREAVIKSVAYLTTAYKEGYIPPEVLTWNDADNNNGFHSKLFVMDLDGTISTELAMINDKQAYYQDSVTRGLPRDNSGKQMPAIVAAGGGFIPRGAKNVQGAKEFMKYFMQPQVMNANLKGGLGRWVPAIPDLVKQDPFWLDPSDPHRQPYVTEAVINPTIPAFEGYNPAWGRVAAEQLWGQAHADVIKNGMTPEEATAKALKRAQEIFARYPIAQS